MLVIWELESLRGQVCENRHYFSMVVHHFFELYHFCVVIRVVESGVFSQDFPCLFNVRQTFLEAPCLNVVRTQMDGNIFLNEAKSLDIHVFNKQQTSQGVGVDSVLTELHGYPDHVITIPAVVDILVEQVEVAVLFVEQTGHEKVLFGPWMLVHTFLFVIRHVHRPFDHREVLPTNENRVKNFESVKLIKEQNQELGELLLAQLLINRKQLRLLFDVVFRRRVVDFN